VRQVAHDGTPETTFYVYDAAGQRVRNSHSAPSWLRQL